MGESLIQLYRVGDEDCIGCKALYSFKNYDKVREKSPGQSRASSRGNTRGASVIRNDWA
jgi:hypothetical protein